MKVDYLYKHGGKESAAYKFNKHPRSSVLLLTLTESSSEINVDLSVAEAKELATMLLDYVNDIEEYAKVLKQIEEVTA